MTKTEAVATTEPASSPAPTDRRAAQKAEIEAWLKGADIVAEDDTTEIDLEDALRILSATDQAEVLRVNEMRKIDDYAERPLVVLGVTWRKSTRSEDGAGRYAVIHATDEDGEPFLVTCGATKVVLQLRKAELEGWFPWQVQVQITKTDANRTVKELVAPEKPF
jgi:hypothetical protein